MQRRLRTLPGLVGIILLVVTSTPAAVQATDRVLVFAAASTREVVEAAIDAFAAPSTVRISGVYAASSALARQILSGAPASLFLSANTSWMERIAAAGLIARQAVVAGNRLVLVAPKSRPTPARLRSATDIAILLGDSRLAVAAVDAVPAGLYARQALTRLGVWNDLAARLAQASNVRAALLLVERRETALGLVYATDAHASAKVTTVWQVPDSAHDPITYPLALLTGDDAQAAGFFRFLVSPAGQEIFVAHGFRMDHDE